MLKSRVQERSTNSSLSLTGVRVVSDAGFESEELTLELSAGDFGLLTGPGGSGKSLLLEALAGIDRPGVRAQGEIIWHGAQPVQSKGGSPRFALIPQDTRLAALPTDRVTTLLGGKVLAEQWLPRVGLDPARLCPLAIRVLSAGERTLVLLARALARPYDVLLFDGYGETLDPSGRGLMLDLLEEACQAGKIVLLTTRERTPSGLSATHVHHLGTGSHEVAVPLLRKPKPTKVFHRSPLLEVQHVHVSRGRPGLLARGVFSRGFLPGLSRARMAFPLQGVTFFVRRGETLVLLGPSGSGKTTLLETMAGLRSPEQGRIRVSGVDVSDYRGAQLHRVQREVQLVFQDATSVLDGERTVEAHLLEAAALNPTTTGTPTSWLERLGLPTRLLELRADALSASEAARVDLVRSLAVGPKAILFDEPRDAALGSDAAVLTSLIASEKEQGMSFLLATSEPNIARSLADSVAILHRGHIIEFGRRSHVLGRPAHPETPGILAGGAGTGLADPRDVPLHCPFAGTCSRSIPRCSEEEPLLVPVSGAGERHRVACFNPQPYEPGGRASMTHA